MGAVVSLNNSGDSAITDSSGAFRIHRTATGIRKRGFASPSPGGNRPSPFPDHDILTIRVIDPSGKVLRKERVKVTPENRDLLVQGFPAGLNLVRIEPGYSSKAAKIASVGENGSAERLDFQAIPPDPEPLGKYSSAPDSLRVFKPGYSKTSVEVASLTQSNIAILLDTARVRSVTGYRQASETWSADTTYLITGNTLFDSGTTLTILPGTQVKFSDTAFYLYASMAGLKAVGTSRDSIIFGKGQVRVRWRGPSNTFNPDGSYLAGPRFEYCSIRGALYIDYPVVYSGDGGYGVYLKNSFVNWITGNFFFYARGGYIEKCFINTISGSGTGFALFNGKILNSYIGYASIRTDPPASTLSIRKCDIKFLGFNAYDFGVDITQNTIRGLYFPAYSGSLSGNNFLPSSSLMATAVAGTNANLQGNYWGPALTAEMEAAGPNQDISGIMDIHDDVSLGKIDYGNWKTGLIPNAAPDW